MNKTNVKELWGVEFHLAPEGLNEEEVVSYVNSLRASLDRQSALQKLAEQTVVEADRLAESIKKEARKEAEEEAARILSEAEQLAKEQTRRLVQKAERAAKDETSAVTVRAEEKAEQIAAEAEREAELITQAAREQVPGIAAEAKLEAEYIVRKFTVSFVERLRAVINEASNDMIPGLDELVRNLGYQGVLEEGSDSPAVVTPGRRKAKSTKG